MNGFRKFKALAAGAAIAFASMAAQADVFTFSNEFSGGDSCNGDTLNSTCATLTVTDNGAGGVDFVFQASLAAGEFISELSGNIDTFVLPSNSATVSTGRAGDSFSFGEDDFKADGDGFFDWLLELDSAPPGDRFGGTDVISWTFDDISLASVVEAISVDGPEGKTGFSFAIHVQGIRGGDEGSGWFNGDGGGDDDEVPEPATLALVGIALLAAGAARRRKA